MTLIGIDSKFSVYMLCLQLPRGVDAVDVPCTTNYYRFIHVLDD
jgi:hypothetical protein